MRLFRLLRRFTRWQPVDPDPPPPPVVIEDDLTLRADYQEFLTINLREDGHRPVGVIQCTHQPKQEPPMLMKFRYDGPIRPGMVFRHRSFDIRCEVVDADGCTVATRALSDPALYGEEMVAYPDGAFRSSWSPVR